MNPQLAVVEFEVDEARCSGYAAAGRALQVFFASQREPETRRFAWSQLPAGKRLPVRRWLAVTHALRNAGSQRWVGVQPRASDMVFLDWLARRYGKPLEFWLGEEQGKQWITFLLLRALGSHSEATHWRTGLAAVQGESEAWDK